MALPLLTPLELENQRLQQQLEDEFVLSKIKLENLDAQEIENATPLDLKVVGIAKLPLLLLVIGNQVKQIINTSLSNIVDKYISKYLNSTLCPTSEEIHIIKSQRDNIVTQLNRISKNLNRITLTLTGVVTFLNILKNIIQGINLSKITAKIAAVAFPPLAATLPTTLNTLDIAKNQILIDDEGNSRLKKISYIVGSAGLVVSIVGNYILISIKLLESIDLVLRRCDPNITLESISAETLEIADAQQQASTTQNTTTYQGFIIEIEEIPFTPTVKRKRAIGKNQQGITLIQTPLSFTSNNQILINELKLIIDRDNLKAY